MHLFRPIQQPCKTQYSAPNSNPKIDSEYSAPNYVFKFAQVDFANPIEFYQDDRGFCMKSKPNCNACPMRAECRHFASPFARSTKAIVEDRTFGLKNKNKSKNVQKYVQSLQHNIQPKPDDSKLAAKFIDRCWDQITLRLFHDYDVELKLAINPVVDAFTNLKSVRNNNLRHFFVAIHVNGVVRLDFSIDVIRTYLMNSCIGSRCIRISDVDIATRICISDDGPDRSSKKTKKGSSGIYPFGGHVICITGLAGTTDMYPITITGHQPHQPSSCHLSHHCILKGSSFNLVSIGAQSRQSSEVARSVIVQLGSNCKILRIYVLNYDRIAELDHAAMILVDRVVAPHQKFKIFILTAAGNGRK
ncbi:hypothetical protein L1887_25721 [Cichorium endivia]|nr:hypothetical protein L1887_25721 [Cichorium endivia]